MKPYIKNYTEYFGIGEQDVVPCEVCNMARMVDVHHLRYRSEGGSDKVENLIGVCRHCHELFHKGIIKKSWWIEYAGDVDFRKERINRLMFGR